ncbi:MAG: hypothetical protein ACK415_09800 [Thermodesulfovibrionales bacterium]
MKKALPVVLLFISIVCLIPLIKKTSTYMSQTPFQEKLGYIPSREIMKIIALDHKPLIGDWLCFKVITYYGGKIDPALSGKTMDIEFPNMYKFMDVATHLDPYNIDAYYFTEAAFTWGLGRIREVNRILERGVQARQWDSMIPFFMGFNYFYFLKDFINASNYMKIATERSKNPMFANLTARFLYESENTPLAIEFLRVMISEIHNEAMKKDLETRLKALEAVYYLERGVETFKKEFRRSPGSIDEMLASGIIDKIPRDPYGGRFYIDENGRIRSTSKFAFIKDDSNKDRRAQ